MPRIFISYRRSDSAEITEKIYQRFVARLGRANVFKDVNNIPVGRNFRAVIEEQLLKCDIMLVIIGPTWLTVTDAHDPTKRRLSDPDDAVRAEVELGLRHVQVIPVLVNGAHMPGETELPVRMAPLSLINAPSVNDGADFERDVQRLVDQIAPRRRGGWIAALVAVGVIIAASAIFAAFSTAQKGSSTPTEVARISTATSETLPPSKVAPSDTLAVVMEASPSKTPSPTSTHTASATNTSIPSATDTQTKAPTHTKTATPTATDTATGTATDTWTATDTPTFTPTLTDTPQPTATNTATATNSWTPTLTQTPSFTATQTPSSTPTATDTPSPIPSLTPTPTNTSDTSRPTLLALLQNDPAGRFTALLAALTATGLDSSLAGGSFTLLAPSNDAFTALETQMGMTQDQLLNNSDTLKKILLYHIIPGKYFFRQLTSGPTLNTLLQGQSVTFNLTNGTLTVQGADIRDADYVAANGIIDVLDSVMLPPGITLNRVPTATLTSVCSIRPIRVVNLRTSPSTASDLNIASSASDSWDYPVLGKRWAEGYTWYQLDMVDPSPDGVYGLLWVRADLVTLTGDCSQLQEK